MANPTDPNQVHIMVDLETLSTRANATILSIGAVRFTLGKGIIDTFYINVDGKSCKEAGLHVSKDTVKWWSEQNKEALKALLVDPQPLTVAMNKFYEWCGNDEIMIWGNGASFDVTILEEAFEAVGVSRYPWKHWNIMCFRTVMNLMGIRNSDIRKSENDTHHHALDDALSQTKTLIKVLTS
jgi:DNA polymerase III epsilon subunit-like protein